VAKTEEVDIGVIIQGCIRKNENSREVLYRMFFGYAMSVALLYSNDRSDATEIIDDSFLKVFKEIKRYDPGQPFKGWLRRIVINTAIDKLRREARNKGYMQIEDFPLQDTSPGVISELTAEEIMSMLNLLPRVHKTVFSLYEIEGYSHEEISRQLNIPESSSRVYLSRSKRRLQELFMLHYNSKRE